MDMKIYSGQQCACAGMTKVKGNRATNPGAIALGVVRLLPLKLMPLRENLMKDWAQYCCLE
jgi:hypothetical protein